MLQATHSHFAFSFDLQNIESACCDMCSLLFVSSPYIYCQLHFSTLFATTDTLTTLHPLFYSLLACFMSSTGREPSTFDAFPTTTRPSTETPPSPIAFSPHQAFLLYLPYSRIQYRSSESHPCASSFSLKLTKLRTQHRSLPASLLARLD